MKRKLWAFLLVPIILIAFVSCEGDIFGTITNFMDQTSQNVLVSSGMVTVDTAQVDAVADSVSTVVALNTNQPATFDSTDSSFDQAAVDAYNEAFTTAVEETKTQLKEVLESPAKVEELKEQLSATVVAADVPVKVSQAVDQIKTDLDIDFEIETEADLLVATLIVSVMDSPTFTALQNDPDSVSETDAAALVADALQVVDVVKAISPTGTIELDSAVNDLLNSFLGGEDRAVSRVEVVGDGEDWGAILSDYIVPIINPVLDAMDTSGNGSIEESELRGMVRDYGVMRRGYERMAPGLVRGNGTIRNQKKLSDLINYALSVIFSSGRTLLDGYTVSTTDNDFLEFLRDVQAYLTAYETNPEADFESYIDTTFISTSIETNYNTVLDNHGDTIGFTLLKILMVYRPS